MRSAKDEPFFLYLAHMYVHLPIYVQQRFLEQSQNGRYGAAVASIDWAAGVLLAELHALGLDEDTIVIFTSDNGSRARDEGGSNLPLRGEKATTWEGGMRVPCLVRWPGHVPAGEVRSDLTTSMDLLPTLATVCGAGVPGDRTIDGRDISGILLGHPDATSPHEAFWYYLTNQLCAVRSGRWKLHVFREGAAIEELYDLVDDPGETTDVAPAHPEVVADLLRHAEDARAELGDAATARMGAGRRPAGEVTDPVPLTTFDPAHPYYLAEYDLTDMG
jgi:arylsulfatase A-like enzyme